MRRLHVVVPAGYDDPRRPSGGNVYDRRLLEGLDGLGWRIEVRAAAGDWPAADDASRRALADALAAAPDGALALVDGLVASAVPEVLVPAAARLRVVVLVHMPLGATAPPGGVGADAHTREAAVLGAAAGVLTTSAWTRDLLRDAYGLPGDRLWVAEPGVDPAPLATPSTGHLLCVGAVIPGKGHDVLLRALATLGDLAWRCTCVGSLDRDPAFIAQARALAAEAGLTDRVSFAGALAGPDLDAAYAGASVLVHPSRAETYGMVVTEALARGVPVVASAVGGVPEALGRDADGSRPGLLVPADDPGFLAEALRCWLTRADVRRRLQAAARDRRTTLPGWAATAAVVSRALDGLAG